ncbi:hypothetical protein [uncultured Phycicoccus sp.]|uniref:hypothetical protein n=1 Tax=uncultured Phycicoccus sp. TaxID=661422 RepID=UPI00262460A7|nr:hypothetical protein [uncultured Phycicoccus sp.]
MRRTRLVGTVVLTLALGLMGQAAQAISWGTVYLKNGSTNLGSGYGSAYKAVVNGGDALKVTSTQKDLKANGNPIYTKANWYFNGTYCYPSGEGSVGCGSGWYGAGSTSSPTTVDYGSVWVAKALSGTADSARAGIMICEKQPWYDPDDCTWETFRGISY